MDEHLFEKWLNLGKAQIVLGDGNILLIKIKIKWPAGKNLEIMTFRYRKTLFFDKFLKNYIIWCFYFWRILLVITNPLPLYAYLTLTPYTLISPFRGSDDAMCGLTTIFKETVTYLSWFCPSEKKITALNWSKWKNSGSSKNKKQLQNFIQITKEISGLKVTFSVKTHNCSNFILNFQFSTTIKESLEVANCFVTVR